MSRMDRYKDIHKKAKPLKRDTGSTLCIEAFISLFFIKLSKNDRLLSIGYRILYLSVRNEEEPQ